MNKNPILVLTGLAIVAVAAVAGLTRDQWMAEKTQTVAAPESSQESQPAAPADQPAAEAPSQQQATAPAAEPETPPAASKAPQPEPNGGVKSEVPAFDTVRVEKTGEAVIAGTAEAGAEVVVKLDGAEVGKARANGDGAFVVVTEKPLPPGSGALTLEAKSDGGQAPVPSEQSVAVIVPAGDQQEALVAVVSPDEPTKVLQKPAVSEETQAAVSQTQVQEPASPGGAKPAKLVSIDAVDYDASGNIVFSGQGELGHTARIYVDNNFIGDAAVGQDGRWSFSGTADIAQGVHTLRVDGLDGNGSVVNRVEVPFFREHQTKVAEATQAPAAAEQEVSKSDPAAQQPVVVAAPPPAGEQVIQPDGAPQQETQAAAAQSEPAAAAAQPKEGRVVIQPGNNLWRISRVLYGSGTKYTLLFEANKDQIRNPNLIYPGQIFKTPDVAPASETIDPKRREPLAGEENSAGAE